MADTRDLGSRAARRAGSSPVSSKFFKLKFSSLFSQKITSLRLREGQYYWLNLRQLIP